MRARKRKPGSHLYRRGDSRRTVLIGHLLTSSHPNGPRGAWRPVLRFQLGHTPGAGLCQIYLLLWVLVLLSTKQSTASQSSTSCPKLRRPVGVEDCGLCLSGARSCLMGQCYGGEPAMSENAWEFQSSILANFPATSLSLLSHLPDLSVRNPNESGHCPVYLLYVYSS